MAYTNRTLKDGAGNDFSAPVWTPGRDAAASSQPVALSTEDKASLDAVRDRLPSSLGPKTGAGSMSVVMATDAITPVVGFAALPSSTFTRPADTTAYSAGDLIANSTTNTSVTPLSWTAARVAAGSFLINRVRLRMSGTTIPSSGVSFRVYLFNSAPTVANGDNGALSITGSANCIGWADITLAARADSGTQTPFADGCFGFGDTTSLVTLASGQTIWGLIEARAGYTPASGSTWAVSLEIAQN